MAPAFSTTDTSFKRRSTRVAEAVFLTVSGVDGDGQPFVEQTGTIHLSFHGCSYFSKHARPRDSWLTLEIPDPQTGTTPHKLRARVVWNRGSRNLHGVSQVGVEFEAPGNVWGLANPPLDWQQVEIPEQSDAAAFEREMKELLAVAVTGTYYQLLRVTPDAPRSQVRHNYYELARKYHPDLHMAHPEWMQSLHQLMDVLTVAYETLTDEVARKGYDRRLVASGTFALGRHGSELQKTASECAEKAQECFRARNYGGAILWLRKAVDMDPASSTYRTLLARSLSAVPAYRREALEQLQKAIVLDSLNTAAHFQLAELYEEMKLPWRARPHYRKVLEIDSENSKARERVRAIDSAEDKNASLKRTFIDRIFGRFSK